jgi:hypothetical protein
MQYRRRTRAVCAPRGAATPGDARKSSARNRLRAPAARGLTQAPRERIELVKRFGVLSR